MFTFSASHGICEGTIKEDFYHFFQFKFCGVENEIFVLNSKNSESQNLKRMVIKL